MNSFLFVVDEGFLSFRKCNDFVNRDSSICVLSVFLRVIRKGLRYVVHVRKTNSLKYHLVLLESNLLLLHHLLEW